MNVPQIYLIEPYNAYATKGRKKHWTEIVEEQALLERIIAEANSRTLPPNSPSVSTPAVGNSAAGAGGQPVLEYFHSTDVVNFSALPLTGDAPLTVQFTNLTPTPQFDIYLWEFGDGTTSSDINPIHVYQSGSDAAGYTASLQVTHSGGATAIETKLGYISASIPTVTAAFTFTTSSGPGPITASFVNTSINTSQTPTTTYLWDFGDGSSSLLVTPLDHPYLNTGSFTASLQATGSYDIASLYTQSFFVPAPTLVAGFTFTTSSNTAPSSASFVNTTTYNGSGTLTYLWTFDSGSITSSLETPPSFVYTADGSYTASLQVTESKYGITSLYTQSFVLG
jgi:PKD repeat protein